MAARRLLILMLVLLAVSTLAAALVPPQDDEAPPASTSTDSKAGKAESGKGKAKPPGRLVSRTIRVAPNGFDRIPLVLGDQLALTVRSGVADQVSIPAFGVLEDITPVAPARFNLLPERTGVFEVRLVEARRVIGRIRVRAPGTRASGDRRDRRRPERRGA